MPLLSDPPTPGPHMLDMGPLVGPTGSGRMQGGLSQDQVLYSQLVSEPHRK